MRTHIQTPEVIKVGLDEELLYTSWKSVQAESALAALNKTLDSK